MLLPFASPLFDVVGCCPHAQNILVWLETVNNKGWFIHIDNGDKCFKYLKQKEKLG